MNAQIPDGRPALHLVPPLVRPATAPDDRGSSRRAPSQVRPARAPWWSAAPPPTGALTVTHDDQGALWVLALAGEADISTLEELVRGLANALAMNRGVVAVDVSELEFCDSWSVDAVLEANSSACSSTMVLVGGHGVVSRVFDLLDPEERLARHH